MPAPKPLNLTLNGRAVQVETDPDRMLLEVLREDLKLTGTKYGCGEGACGACAVLVDGRKLLSCSTPVVEAVGKSLVTIEGLADGETLHPVQEAFMSEEAFQCGYCTPGMIIATVSLLNRVKNPSDEAIAESMNDHLCRCCGYGRIRDAVRRATQLANAGDPTGGR